VIGVGLEDFQVGNGNAKTRREREEVVHVDLGNRCGVIGVVQVFIKIRDIKKPIVRALKGKEPESIGDVRQENEIDSANESIV